MRALTRRRDWGHRRHVHEDTEQSALVERILSLRKSARTRGSAGKVASPKPRGSISSECNDEKSGRSGRSAAPSCEPRPGWPRGTRYRLLEFLVAKRWGSAEFCLDHRLPRDPPQDHGSPRILVQKISASSTSRGVRKPRSSCRHPRGSLGRLPFPRTLRQSVPENRREIERGLFEEIARASELDTTWQEYESLA